ncbi:MAG: orotate phosphoribosyltransferase [Christensenellaceae bacterium]|jgi:orotate phosphoribosyltransferase|nr:orotate phosphoribosyltransferase [Christensenellaceae bacterium]
MMEEPISGICDITLATQVAEELLRIKAVFLRPSQPFTWASGIKSPIYCDNRLILGYPEFRNIVCDGMLTIISKYYKALDVVMGAATGGIPHASLVSDRLSLPMGYVRSGAKEHGRENKVEGAIELNNKNMIVVEDLISTAGSSIDVVESLRESGGIVLGIVSIFTYSLQKGIDNLIKANVRNVSLCDINTLVDVAVENGYIKANEKRMILNFIKNPSDPSWQTE